MTATVASPCVITWPAHGLNNGDSIYFSSSFLGGLPAPILHFYPYFVTPIDANTFHISTTNGGAFINTTGAQNGTHTGYWNYGQGDVVAYGGAIYYCPKPLLGYGTPGIDTVSWHEMAADAYEIPNPYAAADLFSIHYVQSADVMTLVHVNYPPQELRRESATSWSLVPIAFEPAIDPPANVVATTSPGFKASISGVSIAPVALITTAANHTLSMGDQIYMQLGAFIGGVNVDQSGFYIVQSVPSDSSGNLILNDLTVMYYSGGTLNSSTWTSWDGPAWIELADKVYDPYSHYAVSAVAANEVDESVISSTVDALNNLDVPGSYNTITWDAVDGASRYNVYKQRNGLFGYIGETTALVFVDDNIAPDFSIAPPYYDGLFSAPGDYPGAVSYNEQRRCFGGTLNQPEGLWMSNSGTDSTFSYSLPTKATDRIAVVVAGREANVLRHLVPLQKLILMSSAAEWAVQPLSSDAITPTSISVQAQAYIGANNVQPSAVNNLLVFCAARGGHVRELGYQWQANCYVTGDLSLRATHLFDNQTLLDQTYGKAPRPILWFVSSGGTLIGLTYVPEEQIGSWHQHDTDGWFESVCSIAEGTEDYLYAVIRRIVNGFTVRYIERMASRLGITSREQCVFLDSALTYDGDDTGDTILTLGYIPASFPPGTTSYEVPITASDPIFASTDVGDALVLLLDDGTQQRVTISLVTSATAVGCVMSTANALLLQPLTIIAFSWARLTFSGLDHLEGKTVTILADGAVLPPAVVTGGQVEIVHPSTIVTVGLPYVCDVETLPLTLQIDGYGMGRNKNINKAWIKVWMSSGIFIGPDEEHLIEAKPRYTEPYGSPPALQTDEIMVMTTPAWQQSGQILIRQVYPLPLSVVGLTLEVSIGG